jgi:hypothetical protein
MVVGTIRSEILRLQPAYAPLLALPYNPAVRAAPPLLLTETPITASEMLAAGMKMAAYTSEMTRAAKKQVLTSGK